MTKFLTLAGVILLCLLPASCFIETVPVGYVGVKTYLYGSSKGVDTEVLGVGRYWIGFNEDLRHFPTFSQNYVWTASSNEGSRNDESISFQTVEGLSVSADIGITYNIEPDKVSLIFQKYRKGVGTITDVYIRNMVRDAIVTVASSESIKSVYGSGKTNMILKVTEIVKGQVADIGISIEKIYWIGDLRLPETVTKALNAKIEATQRAEQRKNEVAEAKAEAEKKVAEARGIADSKLMLARAEAEAIRIKGKSLKSNPELVSLMAVEKWDGVLPKFTGGVTPFINIDK